LTEAIDPVMKIEPPSLNSGNAFCTVNSVPRAFSPKVASKCCSVISPSWRSSPVPALVHNTSTAPLFPPDRVEQTVQIVQVGRISLHTGHVSADQLHGFIQGFLPPTRDEDVSSLFNEQLGTGQRHTT
jgi:hypothetical protein